MQTESVMSNESGSHRTLNGTCRGVAKRHASRAWASITAGLALALAGCSGISPATSPSKSFEVDVPLKAAYERAVEQSKMCLVTKDNFPLTAEINEAESYAFVRVNMHVSGTLLSNVRIVAQSPTRSRVSVQMWGVDVWDMTAVDAMQAAIEFGVPSCVNYFPTTNAPAGTASRK